MGKHTEGAGGPPDVKRDSQISKSCLREQSELRRSVPRSHFEPQQLEELLAKRKVDECPDKHPRGVYAGCAARGAPGSSQPMGGRWRVSSRTHWSRGGLIIRFRVGRARGPRRQKLSLSFDSICNRYNSIYSLIQLCGCELSRLSQRHAPRAALLLFSRYFGLF
ncbi:unnamed protein product [Leptidea sinapis]|uniref:Uncharacterized protein n=1 Tax=Leptidea sinapis TaxID=189913 RepID=A0A5E4PUM1_9NEOP|nr:unnamed protein product [Leptidea sinapis]